VHERQRWPIAPVRVAVILAGICLTGSLGYADEWLVAAPRLVDRATASLRPGYAIAGISHRGDPSISAEVRLGGIAALGGGLDDRLLIGATAEQLDVYGQQLAWFRLGVEAHRWFRGQPALDVAFERALGDGRIKTAELRTSGTQRWASSAAALEVSAGVGLWDIEGGVERLSKRRLRDRVRPFVGVAWTPQSYPRTSLLLEGSFGPSVIADRARLDWRLGWGARYQVFAWSSIDLVVRNRQDAGLAGSTVMVRVSAELR
jgi:hypothetical protein